MKIEFAQVDLFFVREVMRSAHIFTQSHAYPLGPISRPGFFLPGLPRSRGGGLVSVSYFHPSNRVTSNKGLVATLLSLHHIIYTKIQFCGIISFLKAIISEFLIILEKVIFQILDGINNTQFLKILPCLTFPRSLQLSYALDYRDRDKSVIILKKLALIFAKNPYLSPDFRKILFQDYITVMNNKKVGQRISVVDVCPSSLRSSDRIV
ncbi:hypothetical protein AGLY_009873 [Aphis glycines]|uniref:Uncharacterized protein n=1 Tax=Aphis glycines TaxID=307491 RepID=A0A6G0TJA0_APHGL|nr:hypothetical protein AGLY_009873 [Aphis glycines]